MLTYLKTSKLIYIFMACKTVKNTGLQFHFRSENYTDFIGTQQFLVKKTHVMVARRKEATIKLKSIKQC